MTLDQLHRIKAWHVAHRSSHPVEYHFWDLMLTLWIAGLVGLIPAIAFEHYWTLPVCALAYAAPSLYVAWRTRARAAR